MGFAVFEQPPTSADVASFLARVIRKARAIPKYLIADHGKQFVSARFRAWSRRKAIRQRFGAAGKYGSIAVIERFILTIFAKSCRCSSLGTTWIAHTPGWTVERRMKSTSASQPLAAHHDSSRGDVGREVRRVLIRRLMFAVGPAFDSIFTSASGQAASISRSSNCNELLDLIQRREADVVECGGVCLIERNRQAWRCERPSASAIHSLFPPPIAKR